MKLKYYLRGIGLGIIFATIVMTVSSGIHNNNLSNEFIIKEAQKLGMVMPEEEDDGGLWGNSSSETEKDSDLNGDAETEHEASTENGTVAGDDATAGDHAVTEDDATAGDHAVTEDDATTGDNAATGDDMITGDNAVTEDENQQENAVYHTVTIVGGDSAQIVGEKLYEAGIVTDLEGFHLYVKEQGYTTKIRAGEYQIPEGASYEEICKIILKRKN